MLKTKRIIKNFFKNFISDLNKLPTTLTQSTSLTTSPYPIIVIHININNVLSFNWLYTQILYFIFITSNVSIKMCSNINSYRNSLNDIFSKFSWIIVAYISNTELFRRIFMWNNIGNFSSNHFMGLMTHR